MTEARALPYLQIFIVEKYLNDLMFQMRSNRRQVRYSIELKKSNALLEMASCPLSPHQFACMLNLIVAC
jgi:hypothetical protein